MFITTKFYSDSFQELEKHLLNTMIGGYEVVHKPKNSVSF